MTTAMRRKEDLEEQKEAMLPTLRSKLLAPTDVEEANDRLRRFLLWQALNGVAVMTYYVVRSLYVTRIAGDNPVSGSNLALREAVVATIASVVGANFVPPREARRTGTRSGSPCRVRSNATARRASRPRARAPRA